jgi:ribonuclease P protein component
VSQVIVFSRSFRLRRGFPRYETNIQSQQSASRANPRFSCADGHQERSPPARPASRQGPQATLPVTTIEDARAICELTFEPAKRLHLPAEFRAVKQRGRRFTDAYFILSVLANQVSHPRLGLAIATRVFGTAVARNRIKRLARESFRLNQKALPPVDITVAAQAAARHAAAYELRASLDKHWKTIAKRCTQTGS